MNNWSFPLLVAVIVALTTVTETEAQDYPTSQKALQDEVTSLPWETKPGDYQLVASKSLLKLRPGDILLRGKPARRFMFLNQGTEKPNTEAVVVNTQNISQVIFSYYDVGYVTLDDWEDLDPDDLLQEVIENTEKANVERKKKGIEELRVRGWLQKPTLDRSVNAAYWVLDAVSGRERLVNAVAVKLGRKGYEKLTWVGSFTQYKQSGGLSPAMIDTHKYNTGYRFADYSIGDTLAGFGIASLVAVTAGARTKGGKAGIAAVLVAILAFAKKFILIPILLAFGAVWAVIRRIFRGKEQQRQVGQAQDLDDR